MKPRCGYRNGNVMTTALEKVTEAILPAFTHIEDVGYRQTIATCWARAAIKALGEPDEEMVVAGNRCCAEECVDRRGVERVWKKMIATANRPSR